MEFLREYVCVCVRGRGREGVGGREGGGWGSRCAGMDGYHSTGALIPVHANATLVKTMFTKEYWYQGQNLPGIDSLG